MFGIRNRWHLSCEPEKTVRMDARIRTQIAKWLGEFFREAAVLIAVLAPMELAIQNGFLTLRQWGLIVVLAIVSLVVGFYVGLQKNADE
jgi:hypothetical protein